MTKAVPKPAPMMVWAIGPSSMILDQTGPSALSRRLKESPAQGRSERSLSFRTGIRNIPAPGSVCATAVNGSLQTARISARRGYSLTEVREAEAPVVVVGTVERRHCRACPPIPTDTASERCGKVDPVFRQLRCAAYGMSIGSIPKVESTFHVRCSTPPEPAVRISPLSAGRDYMGHQPGAGVYVRS
jgi:hypothetical protein